MATKININKKNVEKDENQLFGPSRTPGPRNY